MTFSDKLKKPFFALAPMADVTDAAFRAMIAKYGKPDIMWTEFVSADGLASVGRSRLEKDLQYSESERPVVAQVFTSNPEKMRAAAGIIAGLGFDGLDLNMGCPDKKVEKQGGGAAIMKTPKLAPLIVEAARSGAPNISVTVKTRIGYNSIDLEWINTLLEMNLPFLTVHLRTRKEMSDVPAHWELMPQIVAARDRISPKTLIIGNGDVESLSQGIEYTRKYGCDGIMVGRGVFGKPWFFNRGHDQNPKPAERLAMLLEHARLFDEMFNGLKSFDVMKKHFKAYVNGWDGAKALRIKLMSAENLADTERIVNDYLASACLAEGRPQQDC